MTLFCLIPSQSNLRLLFFSLCYLLSNVLSACALSLCMAFSTIIVLASWFFISRPNWHNSYMPYGNSRVVTVFRQIELKKLLCGQTPLIILSHIDYQCSLTVTCSKLAFLNFYDEQNNGQEKWHPETFFHSTC